MFFLWVITTISAAATPNAINKGSSRWNIYIAKKGNEIAARILLKKHIVSAIKQLQKELHMPQLKCSESQSTFRIGLQSLCHH